jgi:uncharacterized protein YdhG (YjbR/CyaY superfamily)
MAKDTKTAAKASDGFTAEEREAMKERAREAKAASSKAEGLNDLLAKIAEMPESDRSLAMTIACTRSASAPSLSPKTWYGMPAYAKDGKLICFFQAASKFKVRYATFGFQPDAKVDDGSMWPVAYALTELTSADEARIAELVKKAAS